MLFQRERQQTAVDGERTSKSRNNEVLNTSSKRYTTRQALEQTEIKRKHLTRIQIMHLISITFQETQTSYMGSNVNITTIYIYLYVSLRDAHTHSITQTGYDGVLNGSRGQVS